MDASQVPTASTLRTPAQTAPVVELRGVSKIYEHDGIEVVALRDVDLEIHSGEFIVMLGPSGSGKSTLLNVLGGLDTPTSGRIRYLDEDLRIDDDATMTWYRRDRVGFVFQFYNLIPSLTALENVALITEVARDPISADEALARVGMSARANHFPSQLSGGEQQRVAIARAIAKRPQLLLCDEPTGALDREHGIEVLEAIDDVNRQLGTPTVVITHNTVIAGMADRVVRLSDGRIARVDRNLERQTARQLAW